MFNRWWSCIETLTAMWLSMHTSFHLTCISLNSSWQQELNDCHSLIFECYSCWFLIVDTNHGIVGNLFTQGHAFSSKGIVSIHVFFSFKLMLFSHQLSSFICCVFFFVYFLPKHLQIFFFSLTSPDLTGRDTTTDHGGQQEGEFWNLRYFIFCQIFFPKNKIPPFYHYFLKLLRDELQKNRDI